jgi:hypothetical protein
MTELETKIVHKIEVIKKLSHFYFLKYFTFFKLNVIVTFSKSNFTCTYLNL